MVMVLWMTVKIVTVAQIQPVQIILVVAATRVGSILMLSAQMENVARTARLYY